MGVLHYTHMGDIDMMSCQKAPSLNSIPYKWPVSSYIETDNGLLKHPSEAPLEIFHSLCSLSDKHIKDIVSFNIFADKELNFVKVSRTFETEF